MVAQVLSAIGGAFTVSLTWRDQTVHDGAVDRFWVAFQMAVQQISEVTPAEVSIGELVGDL